MILIFGSAILCLCVVLIVLDEGPQVSKGGGGRLAGMTDAERNEYYKDVPDRIPTFWECVKG